MSPILENFNLGKNNQNFIFKILVKFSGRKLKFSY